MRFSQIQIVGDTGFEDSAAGKRLVHLSNAMCVAVAQSTPITEAPFAKLVVNLVNATKGFAVLGRAWQHQSVCNVSVPAREEDLSAGYAAFRETTLSAAMRGAKEASAPPSVIALLERVCDELRQKVLPMRFLMLDLRLPKAGGAVQLVYELDETSARACLVHKRPDGGATEQVLASCPVPALMSVFFRAKKLARRGNAVVVLGVDGQEMARMELPELSTP